MAATNEKHLNKSAGRIEIVQLPAGLTALADDLSNMAAVKTAIDALTFVRIASIVDLLVEEDYSDQVAIETDDNGVIYTSASPSVKIGGKYYEIGNPAVLVEMVNKTKVSSAGEEYVGSKIQAGEVPALIVRITSNLANGNMRQVYCIDASFSGVLAQGFLDVNRAGDLPGSNFEFNGNKGGGIFTYTDDVA